ncbi:MAG: integration host factor subunit alpha [Deltaproteobacteria bacterium]|nr:integration host factor subunit alpha [Deltaproteobacteria bacterium]
MSITKSKLIELICKNSNFSKKEATTTIESLLETIKKTLESGEDLLISGFGKFTVKEKSQRRGRNPETGNDLILDARRVVTFKCSKNLRDKLNDNKKKGKKL